MVNLDGLDNLISHAVRVNHNEEGMPPSDFRRWAGIQEYLKQKGYPDAFIDGGRYTITGLFLQHYWYNHEDGCDSPQISGENSSDYPDKRRSLSNFRTGLERRLDQAAYVSVRDRRRLTTWFEVRYHFIQQLNFSQQDVEDHKNFILDCFFRHHWDCRLDPLATTNSMMKSAPRAVSNCSSSSKMARSTSGQSQSGINQSLTSFSEQEDGVDQNVPKVTLEMPRTADSSSNPSRLFLHPVPSDGPYEYWVREKHARMLLRRDPDSPTVVFRLIGNGVRNNGEKYPIEMEPAFTILSPEESSRIKEGDVGLPPFCFPRTLPTTRSSNYEIPHTPLVQPTLNQPRRFTRFWRRLKDGAKISNRRGVPITT